MGRHKGSARAAASYMTPPVCEMSIEDRMKLIANIIADRIQADIEKTKGKRAKETSDV